MRSLGIEARFLRPPYGSFNDVTLKAAEQMDLKVVLWSLDSEDWRGVREDYAALVNTRGQRYVNNDLRGIFLFHDTVHGTLENLPRIIAQLQAGGCQRFVTVSDFLDGSLDPEPPLLMARRTRQPLPDGRELMPPESFPDVQLAGQETGRSGFDAAQRASSTRDTSLIWAAGSTPVPMARSSSPAGARPRNRPASSRPVAWSGWNRNGRPQRPGHRRSRQGRACRARYRDAPA